LGINSVNGESGLSAISRKVGEGDNSGGVERKDFLPLKCNVSLGSARNDSGGGSSRNVSRFVQSQRCEDASGSEGRRSVGKGSRDRCGLVDSVDGC
jgi:hypothetical protein